MEGETVAWGCGGEAALSARMTRRSGTTRPPRLKAKPMAGRRGDGEKRRHGETQLSASSGQLAALLTAKPNDSSESRLESRSHRSYYIVMLSVGVAFSHDKVLVSVHCLG